MNSKKIIIEQVYGGLGDNLAYSTLPEMAHKLGFEVYVSNHNIYRNLDIKRLVWDINPYLKGYTEERGNLNYFFSPNPINTLFPILDRWNYNLNIIQNIEYQIFGLYNNEYPKLYYRPNLIEELSDKIIIDPNSISTNIDFVSILNKYNKENLITLNQNINDIENISSNSIFEWVDMITSSKEFICAYSGGSVIMAAYNKSCTVYKKFDTDFYNMFKFRLHKYIDVD